jgi:hypothetical protein
MKRIILGATAVAAAAVSYIAISASAADRPTGVAARDWVAVTDSLGIVLVPSEVTPQTAAVSPDGKSNLAPPGVPFSAGALLLKPPVGGYFMVRGAAGWTRLVVMEPMKGPGDAG